jgi:hypothetical protein
MKEQKIEILSLDGQVYVYEDDYGSIGKLETDIEY